MNMNLARIEGYLLAKQDHYDSIKDDNPLAVVSAQRVADDFYKLYEIVIDMQGKEETVTSTSVYFSNDEEVKKLKKRIKELEESCENMCEVERNLKRKIKMLEDDKQW